MNLDLRTGDSNGTGFGGDGSSHFTAATLRPELLHKIGESFAAALSRLQRMFEAASTPEALALATREIGRLEQLGVQIQAIARVLSGQATWVHERVDVAEAVRRAVAASAAKAQGQGVTLNGPQGHCLVDVNPVVFAQLLELVLTYALHNGQNVELRVDSSGDPAVPALIVDIWRATARTDGDEARNLDDLSWHLLLTLSRANGWPPQRQMIDRHMQLRLPLADVPACDAQRDAALPSTPVAVGHRVLLVEPHDAVRVEADKLLGQAGLRVDIAANVHQALTMLRTRLDEQLPDVLVIGFGTDEAGCTDLIDALRTRRPRLRIVQLVDDDSAFAFSLPGTDLPARVGRRSLSRTLVSAVSQEIDAAR